MFKYSKDGEKVQDLEQLEVSCAKSVQVGSTYFHVSGEGPDLGGVPMGGPSPQAGGSQREGTGAGGEPLGIYDKITRSLLPPQKAGNQNRILRYVLQRAAGEILPFERVAWCHRVVIPTAEFVAIFHSESEKRAHYANLRACSQTWICPVCSQKVTFERKKDIKTGFANYKAAGGHAYMLTFTLQHQVDDQLQRVLSDLLFATQNVFRSTWWERVKRDFEVQGRVSALEVRWGLSNGWHPHKHLSLLCKSGLAIDDQEQLTKGLTKRYCEQLARRGAYANPDIGVVLSEDIDDDGEYLAKWGLDDELSKGPMKPGRSDSKTPFDLLLWSLVEYSRPAHLFAEYWKNIKGCKQLLFHKGTRKLLGLAPVEATDQELVDQELRGGQGGDDELVMQLALDVWKQVCRFRKRGELLDAVENGGLEGAERLLRGLYDKNVI